LRSRAARRIVSRTGGGYAMNVPTSTDHESMRPQYPWYQKAGAVIFAIFCFELGIALVVFPWSRFWNLDYLAIVPYLSRDILDSPFVKGAVSGVGVLNIYISLIEVFRLRRFA